MNMVFLGIVASIGVACASMGMVGPLVSYWIEQAGVPAWMNGLGTTLMYAGVLFGTVQVTRVIKRIGLKSTLIGGLVVSGLVNLGYLVGYNLYWWMFLRFLAGMGSAGLFVGTEIWINRLSDDTNRGRNLSIYGAVMALGFAIGPFGIILKNIYHQLPLLLAAGLNLIPLLILLQVPEPQYDETQGLGLKWVELWRLVPWGLVTALVYGVLESTMVGNFPIYGLRLQMSDSQISTTIAIFTIGGLLLQVPIGVLADRFGRQKVLLIVIGLLTVLFGSLEMTRSYTGLFWLVLLLAGGGVGSLYFLGLAIIGEKLQAGQLTDANAIYTAHYGLGSIIGPSLGAAGIEFIGPSSFFYIMAALTGVLAVIVQLWARSSAAADSIKS